MTIMNLLLLKDERKIRVSEKWSIKQLKIKTRISTKYNSKMVEGHMMSCAPLTPPVISLKRSQFVKIKAIIINIESNLTYLKEIGVATFDGAES